MANYLNKKKGTGKMEKGQSKSRGEETGTQVLNKNTFNWLWEFTEGKRGVYLVSALV